MNARNKTLLIDCGNTYLKWCVLDTDNLTAQQSLNHQEVSVLEIFKDLIESQASSCDSIVMVSVLGDVFLAGAKRLAEDANYSLLNAQSDDTLINVTNGYSKPENLGNDRLVAMISAYTLANDSQACIVIDSGTATTIDAIDETGQHLGGVIFPGLELSLESLGENTELPPKLNSNDQAIEANGLATDTPQAIASGCLLSLASAIDGICNKMQRQIEENSSQTSVTVRKILCGGGAKALLPYIENSYDYHENLIMLGLKKIKESTVEND